MPKVHIDGDCVVECSHIWEERWNGWAQPVFTSAQKEIVIAEFERLGWREQMEKDSGEPFANEWHDLGNDEWVTGGWIWLEVEGENV
jgi:hypothetical protein